MTSRERLLITLRGGIADRVPVAPFVQEEYLSFYYPDKKSVDRVIDATELANELDFDLMAKHRGLGAAPLVSPEPAGLGIAPLVFHKRWNGTPTSRDRHPQARLREGGSAPLHRRGFGGWCLHAHKAFVERPRRNRVLL